MYYSLISSMSKTPPYIGLLDTYTGATAAYSLRKLRSTYNGNAIRVRRSSDSTTLDIGFNTNGTLNTTAMLAFVGAGNGFVTIWYDQSGNGYNLEQVTSTRQPQIVSSGSVLTLNNKPSMYNNGSTTNPWNMTVTFGSTLSQPNTIFNMGSNSNQTAAGYLWDGIGVSNRTGLYQSGGNTLNLFAGNTLTASYTSNINTQRLIFAKYNGASSSVAVNNGTATTGNAGTQSLTGLTINSNYGLGVGLIPTNQQEFILWNADKATDRTGISDNINTYYSTY